MLCLYNTSVVHNSEIRFDFVTLSCFGYYHLKYITLHGPTPFKMAVVNGKEMVAVTVTQELLPVKYAVLNLKWFICLYTVTPVSKYATRPQWCVQTRRTHARVFFPNSLAVYGLN